MMFIMKNELSAYGLIFTIGTLKGRGNETGIGQIEGKRLRDREWEDRGEGSVG